jgi:hypothetical protein
VVGRKTLSSGRGSGGYSDFVESNFDYVMGKEEAGNEIYVFSFVQEFSDGLRVFWNVL